MRANFEKNSKAATGREWNIMFKLDSEERVYSERMHHLYTCKNWVSNKSGKRPPKGWEWLWPTPITKAWSKLRREYALDHIQEVTVGVNVFGQLRYYIAIIWTSKLKLYGGSDNNFDAWSRAVIQTYLTEETALLGNVHLESLCCKLAWILDGQWWVDQEQLEHVACFYHPQLSRFQLGRHSEFTVSARWRNLFPSTTYIA